MKTPRFFTNLKTAYSLLDTVAHVNEPVSTDYVPYNLKNKVLSLSSHVSLLSVRELIYIGSFSFLFSYGYYFMAFSILAFAIIDAIMYFQLLNFWAQFA